MDAVSRLTAAYATFNGLTIICSVTSVLWIHIQDSSSWLSFRPQAVNCMNVLCPKNVQNRYVYQTNSFQVAEVEALVDLQIVIDSRNRPLAVHRNVLQIGRERN